MAIEQIPGTDAYRGINSSGRIVEFEPQGPTGSSSAPSYVKAANYVPRGDQQITIATLQAVQSLSVPANATVAIIQNNTTQAIRWRDTPAGTNPTTTVGQRIIAGDTLTYDGALANFEAIAEAAGTGTLDIWYGS